jgi:CheY-like chemotaxis protein/HPt (histidine-containing phosphotransfer) domain-containing protein
MEVMVAESDAARASDARESDLPETAATPLRVLLVEDNPVNRRVAYGVLHKLGHTVIEAENGAIALQRLESETFDLVLMDVQMPVMDGFEATACIRTNPRHRDLPIVAMTAHAMKGDRERCLSAGMNDYIAKPIRVEQVRQVLANWSRNDGPSSGDDATTVIAPDPIPGTASAELPLDIAEALINLGQDRELLAEVVAVFVETIPDLLQDLRRACDQSDAQGVEAVAHSLKGSAANICAEPTRRVAERIEELGRQGAPQAASALLVELETHLDRLQEYDTTLTRKEATLDA